MIGCRPYSAFRSNFTTVMGGLVPRIHGLHTAAKAWMAGTSPARTSLGFHFAETWAWFSIPDCRPHYTLISSDVPGANISSTATGRTARPCSREYRAISSRHLRFASTP